MSKRTDAYAIRINSTCPKCKQPAELHHYPAALNHGRGSLSYIHEVRKGLFGFREIVKSCDIKTEKGA